MVVTVMVEGRRWLEGGGKMYGRCGRCRGGGGGGETREG